jgi:hypothetical protein
MLKNLLLRRLTTAKTLLLTLLAGLLLTTNLKAQIPASTALSYNPVESDFTTMPNNIVSGVTGNFTIEAWVYWRGGPAFQRVFDFGTGTGNWMAFAASSNFGTNGAVFAFQTPTASGNIQSPAPLPTNSWTHVAVTIDAAGVATMYINGVNVASGNLGFHPADLGATNFDYLGRSQFPADPYFNGIIDELRLSSVVRYTTGFTPPTSEFTPDANTLGLYHFNEGDPSQISVDASGHLADAMLDGSTNPEAQDPTWISFNTLPVTMTGFSAQRSGNAISLAWKASTKGEGGQFIVERSRDGRTFQQIGFVNITRIAGTSNYSFVDRLPADGKNFYRVRIDETNSAAKYSLVVWVDMKERAGFGLYPNITADMIYVKVPDASNLFIYNSMGALVKKLTLSASQYIDVQGLSKGMYLVRIEGSEQPLRFIKL